MRKTKSDQESSKKSNLETSSSRESQSDQESNEFLTKVKTEVEENSNEIQSLPKMRECRVILRDIRHDNRNEVIGTTQEVKHEPEKQLLIILSPEKIIKPQKTIKIEKKVEDDSETDKLQCQICHKKLRSIDTFRNHKEIHNKRFGCKICGKKYINNFKLLKHIENIHENPGSYKCDVCKVGFNEKTGLTAHQKVHIKNRPKPFKCSKCDYKTDTKARLERHLKTHERIIERCDKCNAILRYKTHDCRLDCKFCGKKFIDRRAISDHIKKHHEQETEGSFHECDICGSKFYLKSSIRIHMEKKHVDGIVQTFTCDLDGKTFKSKREIAQHMKYHQPPVKCDFCLKKLSIRQLKVHIKNSHTGIKQPQKKYIPKIKSFQCSICFKILSTKSGFNRHVSNHNKKFKCKICEKMFGCRSRLNSHIKDFHGNLNGYICEICNKKFPLLFYLKRHMNTHDPNRLRDVKCSQCDFATFNKQNLKLHLNSHKRKNAEIAAMKNPHKCQKCPAVKGSQKLLNRHMKNVHLKELFECDICGKKIKNKINILGHLRKHIIQFGF